MASSSSSPSPVIRQISKCFIKPVTSIPEEVSKAPIYLTNWDLSLLSGNYLQTGLLFSKPSPSPPDHPLSSNDIIIHHEQQQQNHPDPVAANAMNTIIETLKDSLSKVLVHFYPLAGRLKTHKQDSDSDDSSSIYYIYLDCSNPQGAEFVHAASTDLTLDDILSPVDVPAIVKSFFLYNGAVNHDGHTLPLLGVQITELIDGYFIGCSFNHVVGDGSSFWHFFNSWSEISRSKGTNSNSEINAGGSISNPPILKRWFLQGHDQIINLPYSAPEDFIDRFTPKSVTVRERVFHFSAESMSRLKSKANNQDSNTTESGNIISSFQSLCALVWRCVTRVRGIPSNNENEIISRCFLTIGDRARLDPPISSYYLGNCVGIVTATAQVGELLSRDVGWSASLWNQAINGYNNEVVRKKIEGWIESPVIRNPGRIMEGRFLLFGFLRFDVYGNDFGWGKPVAIRRGGTGFDGKITAYPGREGGSSIDLVCCLSSETLSGLESDEEFKSFVSPAY